MRILRMVGAFVMAIVGVSFTLGGAIAAPTTYKIDPGHSEVGFNIRHIFTKVHGRFARFGGTIVHDPQNLAASRVDTEIEAVSISTDNERRDQDLRSTNFFAVDTFPKITFTSKSVAAGANGALTVNGELNMHGVTKPVTLIASFLGAGPGMGGVTRAGFEGSTKINRKEWGINWNYTLDNGSLLLSDDVEIVINIEAMVPPPAAAEAAPKKN